MKYCKNCGKQMSDQSMFCPQCGTRQPMPPQKKDKKPMLAAGLIVAVAVIAAAVIVFMAMGKKEEVPEETPIVAETVVSETETSEAETEKETETAEEEETTAEDGGLGWQKNGDGWSYYIQKDVPETGWLEWEENWYYLDENGMMVTGWLEWEGNWYYLKEDGTMMTGFWPITKEKVQSTYIREENEFWYEGQGYYFLEDGRMHIGKVLVYWESASDLAELQQLAQELGIPCVNDFDAKDGEMHSLRSMVACGYYQFYDDGTYGYSCDMSE